jgi:hypothetical protein
MGIELQNILEYIIQVELTDEEKRKARGCISESPLAEKKEEEVKLLNLI